MLRGQLPHFSFGARLIKISRRYDRTIFGKQARQRLRSTAKTYPPAPRRELAFGKQNLGNITYLPDLAMIDRGATQLAAPIRQPIALEVILSTKFGFQAPVVDCA